VRRPEATPLTRTLVVALLLLASTASFLVATPAASACVQFPPGNGCGWKCTYVDNACVPTPVPCIKVCTDSMPCYLLYCVNCGLPSEAVGYWVGVSWHGCMPGGYYCSDPQVRLPSRFLPGGVWCGADSTLP
jgi:hypothetical protein